VSQGILYSVAMPIGNVADFSHRAAETLAAADIIACEDTRKLKDWLRRTGTTSQARFLAYHSHNESASAQGLVKLLLAGKNVSLVTDAGTPNVSDPGYRLIRACMEAGIQVKPVPGASSLTAILSISPFGANPMLFLGFLSPKSGKRVKTLSNYTDFKGVIAIFESVHRISALLADLYASWGNLNAFIGREMTKKHEEFFWGDLEGAIEWCNAKQGEFVILVKKA